MNSTVLLLSIFNEQFRARNFKIICSFYQIFKKYIKLFQCCYIQLTYRERREDTGYLYDHKDSKMVHIHHCMEYERGDSVPILVDPRHVDICLHASEYIFL